MFFVDPNKKFNLITWQPKIIKRMVGSSLAAEALAMLDGIDSVLYIAALLNESIYKSEQKYRYIALLMINHFAML